VRSGALTEMTQAKLERDFTAKRDVITKLERELGVLTTSSHESELQDAVRRVLAAALAGDVPARSKLAAALPGVVARIICRADGRIRV
jgi:hypothetical protein